MSLRRDFEEDERLRSYYDRTAGELTDDEPPVVEPCAVPKRNTVTVRPGFGGAAYAAGCEDEWANAMNARYGGEW